MKRALTFTILGALSLLGFLIPSLTNAQDDRLLLPLLEPIVAENIHRMQALGVLEADAYLLNIDVAFNGEEYILVAGGLGDHIYLWRFTPQNTIPSTFPLERYQSGIEDIVLTKDGAWLLALYTQVAPSPDAVIIWDLPTGEIVEHIQFPYEEATSIDISPDKGRLLAGFGNDSACIWNIETYQQEACFRDEVGPPWGVSDVEFSPTDPVIAVASEGNRVQLWNLETSEEIMSFGLWGRTVTFSQNGAKLAYNLLDGIGNIVDLSTGNKVSIPEDPDVGYHPDIIAFTSDVTVLLTVDYNNSIWAWDTSSGEFIAMFAAVANNRWPMDLALSSDGKLIALADSEGSISLWGVPHSD